MTSAISAGRGGPGGKTARSSPDAIGCRRRAVEQCLFLVLRAAPSDPLERVPKDRIAAGALVDREVAFEHAAPGAEELDRCLDVGPKGRGQDLRRRRELVIGEIESTDAHRQPAHLYENVRAVCELTERGFPGGEHVRATVRIRTNADRAAE